MQPSIAPLDKVSVVLVDDHAIVRHAIKTTLEATRQYAVVGECGDAAEAIEVAERLKPQLMLVDIGLPGKSGLEVIYELRQRGLATRIGVLTMYEDELKAKQAFAAGALGYILKNTPVQKFLEALEKIRLGQQYVAPCFEHLREMFLAPSNDSNGAGPFQTDPLSELSKREREVFYLLADGMPNRVIAKKLFISPRTVETHRARVIKKLNCNSTADLIRYAIRNNLLSL